MRRCYTYFQTLKSEKNKKKRVKPNIHDNLRGIIISYIKL